MLTLPTNSTNIIGRIFFLTLSFFIIFLLIKFGLKDPGNEHVVFRIALIHFSFKAGYVLYILIAIIGFLILIIIVSLFSINKILIDTTINSITFFSLFRKQTIPTAGISEYHVTVHKNAFKAWHGLLIKTKENKEIQIAGQNIKSISTLRDYLTDKKILFAGEKKMKFPFM